MKKGLFALLLFWMAFSIPSAFAQNNSQEDRDKLSYAIYQFSGIFAGVNEQNYLEARALGLELYQIKNERITSANARGLNNLSTQQLRALVRTRYRDLNSTRQVFNPVEKAAYDQFVSMSEADIKIVQEVANSIPAENAPLPLNQPTNSTNTFIPQTNPNQIATAQPVYITKVYEDKDDVLELYNGAVVKISWGFLGYVGFQKKAVLYQEGKIWKIWVQGKKAYPCTFIKVPDNRPSGRAEVISISEVKGKGKILMALDGSIFEVGDFNMLTTSLWLGPFEALLIDENQLINLDAGDEIIDVTKLK